MKQVLRFQPGRLTAGHRLRISILTVLLGVPVLLPFVTLIRQPVGWTAWQEAGRIFELMATTALLSMIALLVAIPSGTVTAWASARRLVVGSALARGFILAGVFMPLPVAAVAWQVVLGEWVTAVPGRAEWRPWDQGLVPAAFVHGLTAIPWVVWIVASVARQTDRLLEDDAIMNGGMIAVWRLVIWPRSRVAVVAAVACVSLQCATEIPVTDSWQVRTVAEEVYSQLVGGRERLAQAVAVSLPLVLASAVVGCLIVRRVAFRSGPPSEHLSEPPSLMVNHALRWVVSVFVWSVVLIVIVLPVAALLWRAAGGGVTSSGASWGPLAREVEKVLRTAGRSLVLSMASSLVVGIVTMFVALLACWHARRSSAVLIALVVGLAMMPGPLVGLGLKEAIAILLDAEDGLLAILHLRPTFPPLRSMLYDQPSPVPSGWAAMIRLFPIACLMLWPAIRAIPQSQIELARLDGHGRWGLWTMVIGPGLGAVPFRVVAVLAALALGEVSAGQLVNPQFRDVFVYRLFDQMHYGAEPSVAAMSLLQILSTWCLLSLVLALATRTK